jgi:ParB-like chromosome segregation protein Spo0J
MKTSPTKQPQPISGLVWLHRDQLSSNLYNPNSVAPPEMQLLKESILADGWLFPILVFDKSIHIDGLTDNAKKNVHTIIDGFHRYTISKDPDIYALTDGMLPCIILNPVNPLATTVRMNRAKGTHAVLKMAQIVEHEIKKGSNVKQIMDMYGMEKEEVVRLSNRLGIHLSDEIKKGSFSKSWSPE